MSWATPGEEGTAGAPGKVSCPPAPGETPVLVWGCLGPPQALGTLGPAPRIVPAPPTQLAAPGSPGSSQGCSAGHRRGRGAAKAPPPARRGRQSRPGAPQGGSQGPPSPAGAAPASAAPRCSSPGSPHSSSGQTGQGEKVRGPEPVPPPERPLGRGQRAGLGGQTRRSSTGSSGNGIGEWLRAEQELRAEEKSPPAPRCGLLGTLPVSPKHRGRSGTTAREPPNPPIHERRARAAPAGEELV